MDKTAEPELSGLSKREISNIIQRNLGFRMAMAVINPRTFDANLADLADALAKDIVSAPRMSKPKAPNTSIEKE